MLLDETEKADLCQRADDQLELLDQQESEFQTDIDKSNKFTGEKNSINDEVSSKEGVVRKPPKWIGKGSKAYEEALDKVRKAE